MGEVPLYTLTSQNPCSTLNPRPLIAYPKPLINPIVYSQRPRVEARARKNHPPGQRFRMRVLQVYLTHENPSPT